MPDLELQSSLRKTNFVTSPYACVWRKQVQYTAIKTGSNLASIPLSAAEFIFTAKRSQRISYYIEAAKFKHSAATTKTKHCRFLQCVQF